MFCLLLFYFENKTEKTFCLILLRPVVYIYFFTVEIMRCLVFYGKSLKLENIIPTIL